MTTSFVPMEIEKCEMQIDNYNFMIRETTKCGLVCLSLLVSHKQNDNGHRKKIEIVVCITHGAEKEIKFSAACITHHLQFYKGFKNMHKINGWNSTCLEFCHINENSKKNVQ